MRSTNRRDLRCEWTFQRIHRLRKRKTPNNFCLALRTLFAGEKCLSYYLPETTLAYIQHRLYRSQTMKQKTQGRVLIALVPASFVFSDYDEGRLIQACLWMQRKYAILISFVLILLRFSLIFKGFQRLVSWLLHHFYTISAFGFIGLVNRTPIGCLAIRSFIFAARSIVPMHYVWRLVAPIYGASIQSKTTMQGIDLTLERRIRPMMKQINYSI